MPDPDITPEGEKQCEKLNETFPYHEKIDLLVASPIRRTINTALIGFKSEVERGLKVIALPEAQETSDLPCDTGSSPATLRKEFEGKPVDLDLVLEGWNNKVRDQP